MRRQAFVAVGVVMAFVVPGQHTDGYSTVAVVTLGRIGTDCDPCI